MNELKIEKINYNIFSNENSVETIKRLFRDLPLFEPKISIVHFPPGVKRNWSKHNTDQVIWVIDGEGVLNTETKKVHLQKGMGIYIPKDKLHQHGAIEENFFIQLSIIF